MSAASVKFDYTSKHVNREAHSDEVVILVDPYSTGALVAEEMYKRGYAVVALWTLGFSPEMKTHIPQSCKLLEYETQLEESPDGLEATAQLCRDWASGAAKTIVACLAGGEAGVDVADALSEALGVRTNGTGIPNRRDKKVQQELIAAAGLRSVRQAGGREFHEVEDFLQREEYPVVLKPVESAGSDGVKLCHSLEEAKEHFELLMRSQMVNGGDCPSVLCQEFLQGPEYVVDHVSRDGVHKTMMVAVYDKRPTNGSAFVYFGTLPVAIDSPEAQILIPYTRRVLDALGLANGPTHGEVILTKDGPCLVEMNCRAHGGDGNFRPLYTALCGGYSQVEVAADAYLDAPMFDSIPDVPPTPFAAAGQEVSLVSFQSGVVQTCPGFDMIRKLASFCSLEECGVCPGSRMEKTVDLVTQVGQVVLIHSNEVILKRDVERIRVLEKSNLLFDLQHDKNNNDDKEGEWKPLTRRHTSLVMPASLVKSGIRADETYFRPSGHAAGGVEGASTPANASGFVPLQRRPYSMMPAIR